MRLRIASLATLVVVVLVLALLQYRWIDELSDAHETQAQSRLRETISALTVAFDTEVTRSALAFDVPFGSMSRFDELGRRWTEWTTRSRWPGIVSGIALLESSGNGWRVRWLGKPAASDARSILPLVEQKAFPTGGVPRRIVVDGRRDRELLFDGQPSLIRPLSVLSAQPGIVQANLVLVRFDGHYLAETMFPRLLERYSSAEDREEFQFEVRLGSRPVNSGDIARADLFRFRPDCLAASDRPAPVMSKDGKWVDRRGDTHITRAMSLEVLLAAPGRCHVPPDSAATGLMQLVVRRQHGSTSAFFSRLRWRNQVVSSLVLATLLAALGVIVVSAERARRLGRMQTVVSAGISHELRTPLASLRVAADDLMSGQVDNREQARRYGQIIDAQSRRIGHVVDQTLAFASATDPHSSPRLGPVSVADVMRAAVEGLSPTLVKAGIAVEQQLTPDLPRVVADPDLVLRCVTNLIENAIKYAASGGWVSLSAQVGGRSGRSVVEVAVEDRGPGIEDQEMTAVFEPFYRGTSARQSRQPGSGLGLAIVKSAVEAQGGWVSLERAVPHGCRIRLFLLADEQAGEPGGSG